MATPVGPVERDPDDPDLWTEWYDHDGDGDADGDGEDGDEGGGGPSRYGWPVRLLALLAILAIILVLVL